MFVVVIVAFVAAALPYAGDQSHPLQYSGGTFGQ